MTRLVTTKKQTKTFLRRVFHLGGNGPTPALQDILEKCVREPGNQEGATPPSHTSFRLAV